MKTNKKKRGKWSRRDLFRVGSLATVAGVVGGRSAESVLASPVDSSFELFGLQGKAAATPMKLGHQIYESIGVYPFINAKNTNTIIGAAIARPVVQKAMDAAGLHNVQLDELAMGVGQRLAELTGAEWGMVSAGCAAGLKLVTIGILSGGDPERLVRIPDLTGFEKTEVIIPTGSRSVYDHGVRNAGVTVVMVNTPEELANAINPRTAMIYLSANSRAPLTVDVVAKIARPRNIPILADAAGHSLTLPNVHLGQGATVVAYSGGKVLKGPACAGLLLGRKDILMAAWQASAHHHGPGRDNKLGKEEHIGMLAAVEAWMTMDHVAEMKMWNTWLENIAQRVSGIESVKTSIRQPPPTLIDHVTPYLTISWDPSKLNITGQDAADELGSTRTKPRIALLAGTGGRDTGGAAAPGMEAITVAAYMMQPGDDGIVADRIYELLSRKRSPIPKVTMKAPGANLVGRWDVTVEFFCGKSEHTFFIEKQDGNWLRGSHKGTFAIREMVGSIEGDEVKFKSNYRVPGDAITSIFHGALSGDTISGDLDMGEYLTGKFTARRYIYPTGPTPIVVPTGPPQAS
jgi:D-glucosaminate-6-phosphate ammonia-lyase